MAEHWEERGNGTEEDWVRLGRVEMAVPIRPQVETLSGWADDQIWSLGRGWGRDAHWASALRYGIERQRAPRPEPGHFHRKRRQMKKRD